MAARVSIAIDPTLAVLADQPGKAAQRGDDARPHLVDDRGHRLERNDRVANDRRIDRGDGLGIVRRRDANRHGARARSSRSASTASAAPPNSAAAKPGTLCGAMPAKLSLHIRPNAAAGLANDVDAVNQ